MTSSPRSGPERRRTPVAHRQADNVLDIGTGGRSKLAPAARACRGDALRHGGEAQAQQRRGAAMTTRAGWAAQGGRLERAARGRHGAAFKALREGNNWLHGFARAERSATTVPTESRKLPPLTPGVHRSPGRLGIDKTGERATDRVGLASRCYESAVIATS